MERKITTYQLKPILN